MSRITIAATCTACGGCIVTCPERALLVAPKRPLVDMSRCTLCLACIEICPVGAITEEVRGMTERSEVQKAQAPGGRRSARRVDL